MIAMVVALALAACSGSTVTAPPFVASVPPASTPARGAATPAATPLAAATPVVAATPAATKARAKKAPKATETPTPVHTAAPRSTATIPPITAGASLTCPTAATVGSALGISLSNPSTVPGGTGTSLPSGAKGVACDYRGASSNVIIELIENIAPSYISQFSDHFPVPYKSVSGVGDQARSFLAPLNGGKDNEGVVATKGSMLVAITATATPATLTQVEGLVSKLL